MIVNVLNKKVAAEDIVCYKYMDGQVTPVARYRVSKNILAGESPFVPEDEECIFKIRGQHIVENGFIHVFTSYPRRPFFDVYKCIIPKGTEYYEDDNHDHVLAYAAKKIIFQERLESKR